MKELLRLVTSTKGWSLQGLVKVTVGDRVDLREGDLGMVTEKAITEGQTEGPATLACRERAT